MKFRSYFLLFILVGIILIVNNPFQKEESQFEDIAFFRGTLDSLSGPKEELSLLQNFPKALYSVYRISGLGSFYIDSRDDFIKNRLKEGQIWEGNILELMKQFVRVGSIAVDVGAHIGVHTLSMSRLVGDRGKVIAFEPQIKLFSELVMNMLLNRCKNVAAYRCALGNIFTSIEMCPAVAGNEGATPVGKGGDVARMITLDSLNLNNVSFIKLDVENFEYEVLSGAEQTIKKNRPYMIIEIMGYLYDPIPNREELIKKTIQKVESMGYTMRYIEGSWSDWLAIPN